MIYLQVYSHQHYTTLSTDNYIKVRPVAPPRGVIYSADGVVLAGNRPSFNLVGVPEKNKRLQFTVKELSQILDIDESKQSQIIKTLNTATRFTAVPLITDLSEEQVALFSVNSYKFTGVAVEAGLSRFYPLGVIRHIFLVMFLELATMIRKDCKTLIMLLLSISAKLGLSAKRVTPSW